MHGSEGFVVNNHPTLREEPQDKGTVVLVIFATPAPKA